MSESAESQYRPTDPVGRVLFVIARGLAIVGSLILCAMAALTAISVSGRAAFSAPVPGDFELIAIGTGLAVFASLPYCQLTQGNVIVDFFMSKAPIRAKTVCDLLGGLMYLAIGGLLTWRMIYGGIDMYTYSEKSMTINFPRWTTFPVSVLLMSFLVVVIVYTIGRSIAETRAGRYFDDAPHYPDE